MMKKLLSVLFTISLISFSAGEISFKKQREKEVQEQEKLLKEQGNRESIDKTKTVRKNNNKNNIRNKIIEEAKKKLGSPYLWGASGSEKFDCSSFVQYVYKKAANLSLPRVAAEQAQFKPKISTATLVKKGDLLFFETLEKGRISHVGIYIGGGQFIHASSAYKQVTVSSLSGFYREKFRWAISVI